MRIKKVAGRMSVLAVGIGLALGVATLAGAPTALVSSAEAASSGVKKSLEKPVRSKRAAVPPRGAMPSTALKLDRGLTWKSDPKTHSVFAVASDQQLWFIDPATGWPYTIDRRGEVFTADPFNGAVYSLGRLSR